MNSWSLGKRFIASFSMVLLVAAQGLLTITTPAQAESLTSKFVNSKSAIPMSKQRVAGFIVKYKSGTTLTESTDIATGSYSLGNRSIKPGHAIGFGYRTVKLNKTITGTEAQKLAAKLEATPEVLSAEPDYIISLDSVDVKPSGVSAQTTQTGGSAIWGLDRIDQRALPLNGQYNYGSTGSGVTAYVVDTGIRSTHTQIAGRVLSGWSGVSDGFGTEDQNGHGTHVAATIGGTTYGVAKSVKLVPVRVLDAQGSGAYSTVIAGLNWIVTNHANGVPAVANMSLGGPVSSDLDAAVNRVIADGVTMAVAAGNESDNSCNYSPADVPAAITVNASDDTDNDAYFSNAGPCSDLYAPGVDITSAWNTGDNATDTISGTSMATPHVAGVVARILSANPTFTPAQVWTYLDSQTTFVDFGWGAYGDPNKLLYIAVGSGKPTVPTSVATTTSGVAGGSLRVTWNAPDSDGGAAITSYKVNLYSSASATRVTSTCTATSSPCDFANLRIGTTYYFDIVANNANGAGDVLSPRITGVPVAGPPSAPVAPSVTDARTGGSLKISWKAPSNGGAAITNYTVRYSTDQSNWTQPADFGNTTSATVTGLTNSTSYYVQVRAKNSGGYGPWSPSSTAVAPTGRPNAVTGVSVTAANQSLVTSFTRLSGGDTGGSAVSYTARAFATASSTRTVGRSCTIASSSTANSCTITGLANGTTYYVDIIASNVAGTGLPSSPRVTGVPHA